MTNLADAARARTPVVTEMLVVPVGVGTACC